MKQPITPADDTVDLRRGIDHIGVGVAIVVHARVHKVAQNSRARENSERCLASSLEIRLNNANG